MENGLLWYNLGLLRRFFGFLSGFLGFLIVDGKFIIIYVSDEGFMSKNQAGRGKYAIISRKLSKKLK